MLTLKIHLGVPAYNQVVVEVFSDPTPALAVHGAPAPAPVLQQKVVFNIVAPPAGRAEQLEYVNTLRAVDGISPIPREAYHVERIPDNGLRDVTTADQWNGYINQPAYIEPVDLVNFIPQRLLLADAVRYRREAQAEALQYANDRDRDLARRAAPHIAVIGRRAVADAAAIRAIADAKPDKLRDDNRVYRTKVEAESRAETTRVGARPDAIRAVRGGFPLVAGGAPAADVHREIERLASLVKTDEKRLNAAIEETNRNIKDLTQAVTVAQNNATEITSNDRNSSSATNHLTKLRHNYDKIEPNLVALERTRDELNNFLVAAMAYHQRAEEMARTAGVGMPPVIPAEVKKNQELINTHFNRVRLLAYQLTRDTRANVQARITEAAARLRENETTLANYNEGVRVGRVPLLAPDVTPITLASDIEADKISLKHFKYKLDHLVPLDETRENLVAAKVNAEARVEEVIAQEAVARKVFNDVTKLAADLEASKKTLNEMRASLKRAQKAFEDATTAHNRSLLTDSTDEARSLLTKVELARATAQKEYFAIRNAETTLRQKLAEMTPPVIQALRDELGIAGNVELGVEATAALDQLVSTRDGIQTELTRLLPDANRYLTQSLDVDKFAVDVSDQVELVKLNNESIVLTRNIRDEIQFMKDEILDFYLEEIQRETNDAISLTEEYNRKKEYFPVVANKAAADAVIKQKKAQKIFDEKVLAQSAAKINRIRQGYELQQADLNRKIEELRIRRARIVNPADAANIQRLLDAYTERLREVNQALDAAFTDVNNHKNNIERQARAALAASNARLEPVNVARANSPSKWVDKWLEIHGEKSELPTIPSGRYTKAVRKIFEHLLNPNEAEPTVVALTAAADAALGPTMVALGARSDIPRAHAPVDDNPALTNKDIIEIVESTHTSLKQYALVKLNDRPRNLDALKDLDFGTRRTEKEKKALLSSEVLLEKETVFSKHEIRNPALPALVPGVPPAPAPAGTPERIVDYIEQKFDTIDMFNKRKKEASIKHYKNSNESTVVSESAIRAQVTDVVNRIGFPPKNPLDYPHADRLKMGKFPVYYDRNLLPPQQAKIRETVIKVFVELGITERQVLDNVDFDVFPAMPAPAPRRRAR